MFPEPPPSYDMAMAALFAHQDHGHDYGETANGNGTDGTAVSLPTHDQSAATQEPPTPVTSITNAATSVLTIPTTTFPSTANTASLTVTSLPVN